LDDVGWDESQDLDTIEIVNPKRLAHRSRKNGRHVATALSKTWCVWCKHEVASKDFMAHIGHMAEDELDMIIVQSGLVVEGYVLLEDACDEVDTVRTAQRLLQKRFGETAQYSGENGDERFHEYMGVPSVVNQPEEGRRDRHRQRVCNVVKWATTRYGMNHVMKILERGRAP
jgi:hypothetical protein